MRKPTQRFKATIVFASLALALAGNLMIGASSTVTVAPAPVPQTGQRTSYTTGDDGVLQMGIEWDAATRFTDNGDGTVLDTLTGLIWLKNADCYGAIGWVQGLKNTATLENGVCGLSDGSANWDWRLPNVREMLSLIDYGEYAPALSDGHPFSVGNIGVYWTSTTDATNQSKAWLVRLTQGDTLRYDKPNAYRVWPVRGEGITAFYQYLPLVMERGVIGLR